MRGVRKRNDCYRERIDEKNSIFSSEESEGAAVEKSTRSSAGNSSYLDDEKTQATFARFEDNATRRENIDDF